MAFTMGTGGGGHGRPGHISCHVSVPSGQGRRPLPDNPGMSCCLATWVPDMVFVGHSRP